MLIVSDPEPSLLACRGAGGSPYFALGVVSHMERHYADAVSLDDPGRVGCLSRARSRAWERLRVLPDRLPHPVAHQSRHGLLQMLIQHHRDRFPGFRDSNHFSRRFRAVTVLPPREFRRSTLSRAEREPVTCPAQVARSLPALLDPGRFLPANSSTPRSSNL